jgi:hypothetical protein
MDTQQHTLANDTQDRIINRALFIGRRMVRAAAKLDDAARDELEDKVTLLFCDAVAFDDHLDSLLHREERHGIKETESLVARILAHYKRHAEVAADRARAEQQRRLDAQPQTRSVTLTGRDWRMLAESLQHAWGQMDSENSYAVVVRELMLAAGLGDPEQGE